LFLLMADRSSNGNFLCLFLVPLMYIRNAKNTKLNSKCNKIVIFLLYKCIKHR
jgi:hypothetical protein